MAIHVLLVIALAHALAKLTLAVWAGGSPVLAAGSASAPILHQAPPRPTADAVAISAWHLFGKTAPAPPATPPPVSIPATALNLRLVGIFFAGPGNNRALALIADGDHIERGYRPGALLPGEARLERIERDQVIVYRKGREEALRLPKPDESQSPLAPSSPLALPESTAEPVVESGSAPPTIDASAIAGRLRSQISSRPQALEDLAFASPYVQNGQFMGFRLRPGRDRQLFQQLGLNNGDVLTEINGTRLNNPAQGLAILQELMNARRIEARVLRNGTEIPLAFVLDGS